MDSTYNHRLGLRVWWPLSYDRLILPIPWLDHLKHPPELLHSLKVGLFEFLTYGPLVAVAFLIRYRMYPDEQLLQKMGEGILNNTRKT